MTLLSATMKNKRASLLLIFSLIFSAPASADGFSDMFGFMFRMMFTMMDAMSDVMNDDSDEWGGGPITYMVPGLSPWSGMSPMGSPLYGMGGIPGYGGFPANAGSFPQWPTAYPYASPGWNNCGGNKRCSIGRGGYQPYGGYGYQPYPVATLNGQWVESSGEILEIRGNRFRLRNGRNAVSGTLQANNNVVNLYIPRTGAVTQYTYVRNQNGLLLKDVSGKILNFRQYPVRGYSRTF